MEHPISEFKTKRGLARILAACRNTWDGFAWAWRSEAAFRQEIVVIAIATIVALALPLSGFQKLVLVGVLIVVLVVELINSAIEAVVDRISLDRHPLSKRAKDMGSAAVALSIMIAAMAWIVVLSNRYY